MHTIRRSFPTLLRFTIGVIPIYVAYAFLGLSMFWQTGYFGDTTYSIISIFCLMNGDSVFSLFYAAQEVNSLMGILFMLSFFLFFISCVQNIYIAIVADGYKSLQIKPVKDAGDVESDTEFLISPSRPITRTNTLKLQKRDTAKLQSQEIYKGVLSTPSGFFVQDQQMKDQQTQTAIARINLLKNEIRDLIYEMLTISNSISDLNVNKEQIDKIIDNFATNEIPRIIENI